MLRQRTKESLQTGQLLMGSAPLDLVRAWRGLERRLQALDLNRERNVSREDLEPPRNREGREGEKGGREGTYAAVENRYGLALKHALADLDNADLLLDGAVEDGDRLALQGAVEHRDGLSAQGHLENGGNHFDFERVLVA